MIRIDMDMPDKCSDCRMCYQDYNICYATKSGLTIYDKFSRPDFCPLKPIETFGDGVCTKSPSGEEERFTLFRDSLTERKEEQQ